MAEHAESTAREAIRLDGQQLEFFRAIEEREPTLATWYLGARAALANTGNPERFVQAAHSIRELMNNIHKFADVPAIADGSTLTDRFNAMAERWKRGRRSSKCYADGQWSGELDGPAISAVVAVDEAIEWHEMNRPKRKEVIRTAIRRLDVSFRPLPARLEDELLELWDELRTFFINVCHHGRETDDDEFLGRLDALERFVLDRLKPRTFAELRSLDEIIAEAEGA